MVTLTILHSDDHAVFHAKQVAALDPDIRCNVYKNLHTGLWSVRQAGIVVMHTDHILLKDVTFNVSKRGRELVNLQKRKNVHATVSGYLATIAEMNVLPGAARELTYNPYLYKGFVDVGSLPKEMVIQSASGVDMMIGSGSPPLIAWEINS